MLTEIQYLELYSATNIYGSCTFIHKGRVKLFVAARNQVYCLSNLASDDYSVRWDCNPILLANIPGIP